MSNIHTIFWAVLAANILSYWVVDVIKGALQDYRHKKRMKELENYFEILEQQLEDDEADDENEDDE